ncbi:Alpha crystallin/Hsp20 domain-containing protein [Artemisia annua]|uniref:Alpha crystallin/Hsp20 domain-containing protein n=1 Tax=Artemisia annua TaxID=35608 RepID=A0A2U1Q4K9_ARTAN|nr:Alpha crystallin/Hsp20 domain-containing protein [Artemisia annua]
MAQQNDVNLSLKNQSAMIFLPQTTEKELQAVLAVVKHGVAVIGSAAKTIGPLIGSIDISESDNGFLFRIALPGVKKDETFKCDIQSDGTITFQGVTHTGEKKVHAHGMVFEMHTQNLGPPGDFSVSFQLGGGVDPSTLEHVLANSVLEGVVKKNTNPKLMILSYEFEFEEASKQQLKGDLSPSLLGLKKLEHLDLSCNDFGWNQIPEFIGSLANLRYLKLSNSNFGGIIPPKLGNLSNLHTLCLGHFQDVGWAERRTSVVNMEWLSNLRLLRHLDMSNVDLSKAMDWFQVINTLPSLAELHLRHTNLLDAHPHVPTLNITSLSFS